MSKCTVINLFVPIQNLVLFCCKFSKTSTFVETYFFHFPQCILKADLCVVLYSEAMGQDILEYFLKEDEDRWRRFAAMEPLLDETGSIGEPESSATTSVVANGAAAVDEEEEEQRERKDGNKEKAEEDDAMVKRFE